MRVKTLPTACNTLFADLPIMGGAPKTVTCHPKPKLEELIKLCEHMIEHDAHFFCEPKDGGFDRSLREAMRSIEMDVAPYKYTSTMFSASTEGYKRRHRKQWSEAVDLIEQVMRLYGRQVQKPHTPARIVQAEE